MAQYYIRPNSNDKIGYQTSICDNRPKFESQSRISNVKIRYLAQVRMSKKNFEFQIEIHVFGPSLNVKI